MPHLYDAQFLIIDEATDNWWRFLLPMRFEYARLDETFNAVVAAWRTYLRGWLARGYTYDNLPLDELREHLHKTHPHWFDDKVVKEGSDDNDPAEEYNIDIEVEMEGVSPVFEGSALGIYSTDSYIVTQELLAAMCESSVPLSVKSLSRAADAPTKVARRLTKQLVKYGYAQEAQDETGEKTYSFDPEGLPRQVAKLWTYISHLKEQFLANCLAIAFDQKGNCPPAGWTAEEALEAAKRVARELPWAMPLESWGKVSGSMLRNAIAALIEDGAVDVYIDDEAQVDDEPRYVPFTVKPQEIDLPFHGLPPFPPGFQA